MAHRNARLTPHGACCSAGASRRRAGLVKAAAEAPASAARRRASGAAACAPRARRPRSTAPRAPRGRRSASAALCCAASCCCACACASGPHWIAWLTGAPRSSVYARPAPPAACTACARSSRGSRWCATAGRTPATSSTSTPRSWAHRRRRRQALRRRAPKDRHRGIGWNYVHVAVDDATRLAYAEELPDELGRPRPPSWRGRWPSSPRTASRCGACSPTTAALPLARLRRRGRGRRPRALLTRPYRPQTNGKAEAFVKIAAERLGLPAALRERRGTLAALEATFATTMATDPMAVWTAPHRCSAWPSEGQQRAWALQLGPAASEA